MYSCNIYAALFSSCFSPGNVGAVLERFMVTTVLLVLCGMSYGAVGVHYVFVRLLPNLRSSKLHPKADLEKTNVFTGQADHRCPPLMI